MSELYIRLMNLRNLQVDGMTYPPALEFETAPLTNARHPVGPEICQRTGEQLYVLPGGGRATEKQIRGMA